MTVTITANRIVNFSIAFMVCTGLAMLALDSYILEAKQTTVIRNTKNTTDKSAITLANVLAQEKVGGEIKTEQVKSETATYMNTAQRAAAAAQRLIEASSHDPDLRKLQAYSYKERNDKYYYDLYKILELDDTTCEYLRGMLAERSLAASSALPDPTAGFGAPSLEAVKEMERIKTEYDGNIAALLGPEKYAQLCEYEATMPERNQIKQFREELEFSGMPLTVEQETALSPAIESYLERMRATII
jgi:hypothetical protein